MHNKIKHGLLCASFLCMSPAFAEPLGSTAVPDAATEKAQVLIDKAQEYFDNKLAPARTSAFDGEPDELSSLQREIAVQTAKNKLQKLRDDAKVRELPIIQERPKKRESFMEPAPQPIDTAVVVAAPLPVEEMYIPESFDVSVRSIRTSSDGETIAFLLFEGSEIIVRSGDLVNRDFEIVRVDEYGVSVREYGAPRKIGFTVLGAGLADGAVDSSGLALPSGQ